jgi:hypothetical protein
MGVLVDVTLEKTFSVALRRHIYVPSGVRTKASGLRGITGKFADLFATWIRIDYDNAIPYVGGI